MKVAMQFILVLMAVVIQTPAGVIDARAATSPGTLRVAVMDFRAEDSVYQHEVAAKDFSAAVQAAVGRGEGFDLVEREQLAQATQELGLSRLTQAADDAAVRVGKWVKADMLVLGRILRNAGAGTTLRLEILDLDHADVLATQTLTLGDTANLQRSALLQKAQPVAQGVNGLLRQASERYERGKHQTAVALLSFQRIEDRFGSAFMDEGARHTLGMVPDMMVKSFQSLATTNGQIRLIQFPRANRALDEAELVFGGLAQSDSEAWKKLADCYVWTDLVVSNLPAKFWGGPTPKRTVTLAVYIWDGHEIPKLIQEGPLPLNAGGWADSDVAALCERAAGRALPSAKPNPNLLFDNAVRQKLSEMMLDRAGRIGGFGFQAWPDTPENRRQLSDLICTLEIACFLDPQNRAAQEKLVSTRWGGMVGQYALDPFRFEWHASDAWGNFVERFGLGPPADSKDRVLMVNGGVAGAYVHSTMRVLAKFLAWNTVPEDVPENILEEWHGQIAAEFAKRAFAVTNRPETAASWPAILHAAVDWGARMPVPDPKIRLKLIETFWPRCVETVLRTPTSSMSDETIKGIRITCQELGKPELAAKFLSALEPVGSERAAMGAPATAQRAQTNPSGPPAKPNDIPKFVLPRLQTFPPEFKVRLEKVPLPSATSTHPFHNNMPLNSLVYNKGKLWIAVTEEETNSVPGINPDLAGDLTPARGLASHLWVYDPASRMCQRMAGDVARVNVVSICTAGDRLWLAGEGAVSFDPETSQIQRFGVNEGLTVRSTAALAQVGGFLFTAAGLMDLFMLNPEGGRWSRLNVPPGSYQTGTDHPITLCGSGGWLLFSARACASYDARAHAWKTLPDLSPATCATGDNSGIWIGHNAGLSFVETKSGGVQSWRSRAFPAWQAPNAFTSGSLATPYRPWLTNPQSEDERDRREAKTTRAFTQFRKDRQAIHAERQKAGRSKDALQLSTRLRGDAIAAASDGDFLWLACDDQWNFSVLLLHKPTHSWVGYLKIPARVTCLACSKTKLWIGQGYGEERLLEVNKQEMVSVPRSNWAKDEVGEAELTGIIGAMPEHGQALYAFFSGDYAQAAKLLEREISTNASLETLYLLAYCYDDLGLNKPDLARQYFKEIISRYADSPWAKPASDSIAAYEDGQKNSAREKELLARYDRNHDGVLDNSEKKARAADPRFFEEQLATQLGEVFKKYDQNGDGKLEQEELTRVRSDVLMYMGVPVELRAGRQIVVQPLLTKNFPAVAELLKVFDANHDGGLDSNELKALAIAIQKKR
jgi:hypothetical protein